MTEWVKYRNKRNGHEGICKMSDFKAAIKRTTKLSIIEKYDSNPNAKVYSTPEEPEAAKEAKINATKKKVVKKANNKSKNE